ncbi:MAG: hypothetical protein ACTTG4_08515 [Moraxella sp.]
MGRHFINHKTCPECGNYLRSYYFYCGRCGNVGIIDWIKTAKFWLFVLLMAAIVIVPVLIKLKTQCQNNQYVAAMVAGFGWNCAGKDKS